MDDLYGDLENYNDVNALDELRNENKELKVKVEEYGATAQRLQKEFDKLSLEYKKLEINYSSLLKTARAEIERKTQIITNLNMEKDVMVLNSIQNSNKSLAMLRRKLTKDRSASRKPRKDIDVDIGKGNKKDLQDGKKFDAERDRNEENRLPSIELASSGDTDHFNKKGSIDTKLSKVDKTTEIKENVSKGKRALALKHRRKSMPAVGKQYAKFSSDEEYEGQCSTEEVPPREWPVRDDKLRQYDRNKQIHITSETSGIDEKYSSYHESSRETYYKGKPRYNEKYRNGCERYEARHKRLYSPERNRRPRDFPDEHQRRELNRHRVLESPPIDRFDQRRYRRSNFDKEDTVEDRRIPREKLPVKQKAPSEYEVPTSKRPRLESDVFPSPDDERWNIDPKPGQERPMSAIRDHLQKTSCQSPDYTNYDLAFAPAQPIKEIKQTATTQLEDPRLTNKRYVKHIEGDKVIQSSISARNIELKPIDTANWDIPKVKIPEALKKPPIEIDKVVHDVYSNMDIPIHNTNSLESGELQSETNDGLTIDYVTENFLLDYENERHNLKSLGQKIMTSLEEYDKEIVNREIKLKSLSKERQCGREPENNEIKLSKEYKGDTEKPEMNRNSFSNERQEYRKELENRERRQKSLSKDRQSTVDEPKDDCVKPNNGTMSVIDKCKIPKKNPEQDPTPNPLGVLLAQLHSVCGIDKTMKQNETKLDVDKMFSTDDEKSDEKNVSNKAQVAEKKIKTSRQRSLRKSSASEIVEGDLALSDDTTDNMDVQKQKAITMTSIQKPASETIGVQKSTKISDTVVEKQTTVNSKDVQKLSKKEKSLKVEKVSKVDEITKNYQGKLRKRKTDERSNSKLKVDKVPKVTSKAQSPKDKISKKTKKKSPEQKEISVGADKTQEKKTVGKTNGNNVKAKFSDLFGDSSSLITPEDLGLPLAPPARSQSTKKYVPIFEDAQDANDVNVKIVCEKQIQSPDPSDDIKIVEIPKINNKIACGNQVGTSGPSSEPKHDEVFISVQEGTPKIEVVNSELTKEPDVVKTVIIATGVQPRVESVDSTNNHNVVDENARKMNHAAKVSIPISAFATSTPYKKLIEPEVESSCASSEVGVSRDSSSVNQSSVSTGGDLNEDAPDVRIIVKRRRKLKQ